jgi:hypothetical protein
MQIALALYPKFTALDIIGLVQVLADVPGHDVVFVAGEAGPVVDHTGRCPLVASTTFADVTAPDIVVVPGELFADRDDRGRAVAPPRPSHHDMDHQRVHWLALPGRRRDPRRCRRDHALGEEGAARAARRPLHRAARGRAGEGDHRSKGFEWPSPCSTVCTVRP